MINGLFYTAEKKINKSNLSVVQCCELIRVVQKVEEHSSVLKIPQVLLQRLEAVIQDAKSNCAAELPLTNRPTQDLLPMLPLCSLDATLSCISWICDSHGNNMAKMIKMQHTTMQLRSQRHRCIFNTINENIGQKVSYLKCKNKELQESYDLHGEQNLTPLEYALFY